VHNIDEDLEKKQGLWGNANPTADDDAIIGHGCELTLQRKASGTVGSDQTKIGVPSALRHLLQTNGNPGANFLRVKARGNAGSVKSTVSGSWPTNKTRLILVSPTVRLSETSNRSRTSVTVEMVR